MIVCPLGMRSCAHKTSKISLQPSNLCWWWFIGYCSEAGLYNGKKPEKHDNVEQKS